MNIKTKLLLATAAVALFAAPASAFTDGDTSAESAFPRYLQEDHASSSNASAAFASGTVVRPRATVQRPQQRPQRPDNSQPGR